MGIFKKNQKSVNKGIKKVDAVITGLILGGIVASVYGIKKEQEKTQKIETQNQNIQESRDEVDGKMSTKSILKALIFGFKKQEKKQSITSRLIKFIFGGRN